MNTKSIVVGHEKSASDVGFPVFAPGQMLQHTDLTASTEYTQKLTQLMLRSLFGCGVVCGLCVRVIIKCNKLVITVESGVAIDCEGNLIHVPKATKITVDPFCPEDFCELWVVLRGFRKCCLPRPTTCSSDEDEVASSCTREQYWYEIQVRNKLPKCVCGCVPPDRNDCDHEPFYGEEGDEGDPCQCAAPENDCYKEHYEGRCECECSDCGGSEHGCGCGNCACDWILLARLYETEIDDKKIWQASHAFRRFVRPVLMRDKRRCDDPRKPPELGEPVREDPEVTEEPQSDVLFLERQLSKPKVPARKTPSKTTKTTTKTPA